MKQVLRFLALAALLAAPWGGYFNQVQAQTEETVTVAFYPPTEEFATGYTDGTTKTSGDMHCESNGGVQGWMKFDVSSIPAGATINAIKIYFNCISTSNSYVKLTSAGKLDPATASASDLYDSITNATSNYYTTTYISGFGSTGWKNFNMSSSAISNLQTNGLANGYFTVGFYEYETYSGYKLYASGYEDANKPYIEVTYTATVTCSKPSSLTPSNILAHSATLTWEDGSGTYNVQYKKAADAEWTTHLTNTNLLTTTISGLDAQTEYQARVQSVCGGETSNWTSTTFTTECEAISTFPWSTNFDSYTGTTSGGTNNLPLCWNYINNSTSSSYQGYPIIYNSSSDAHSGSNYLRFYTYASSSYADEYAILPEMDGISGLRMKLYARAYSSYNATFHVGVMTDPTDATTFVEIGNYTPTTTTYELYTIPFNTYTGSGKYIAIKVEKPTSSSRYVYIDDITVEDIPSCQDISGLEVVNNSITINSVQLQWTAGGSETQWDIYCTTSNVPPTAETTPTVTGTEDNPCTVSGLTPANHYYAYVRARCSASEKSPWSNAIEFTTECEAMTITAVNFINEGFEDYEGTTYSTNGVVPTCWLSHSSGSVTPHVIGSGYYYYKHEGTKALTFYGSGNNYAALPEITNDYSELQISFWMQCESSSYGTLTLGYITASDNGTFNTFTPIPNITIPSNSSSMVQRGPYYLNDVPAEATRLVFRWYCSSQYSCCIDDVVVKLAPTCRPVSNVACQSTTAHTATLSWTNGAIDQDAWQISYGTTSSFDPASGTIVDVDANPGTIDDLAQSSIYYAYVRANCGGGDYSDWTATTVTITTIAGNVTPTGLAVNEASSNSATATWSGVAGNTLHQSYDIYWALASVEEVPVEPTAPNLIAGINGTSQEITGLTASTNYKVWVRDNCGGDGYSDWSAAVPFTTLAACPNPQNLAVGTVIANEATVTWTTHAENDSYNLMYRKATTAPVNINETYDFEDGTMQGWTTYDEDGDGNSWSVNTSDGNNGLKCMQAKYTSSSYSAPAKNWLISPEIPLGGTLRFYAKRYNGGSGENFQVFVSTTGTDIANFTAISEVTSTTASYAPYEFDLSSYSGNGYVAIRHTAENNQWYLYVDDITYTHTVAGVYEGWQTVNNATSPQTITGLDPESYYEAKVYGVCGGNQEATGSNTVNFTTLPSCLAPTALTVYDYANTYVDLRWTRNSEDETSWQICFNGDEEHLVNVTSGYTVNGSVISYRTPENTLNPETDYTVKVRTYCSNTDQSAWSNVESFTTLEACPVPTVLNATGITTTTADLSWTPGLNETEWTIYYKKTTDDNYTEVAGVTEYNPYTLENLEPSTSYVYYVKANCSAVEESDPSSTFNFQTECEAITTFPWTENFNSLTEDNSIPVCWNNEDGTTTTESDKWCYNTSISGNGATNGTSHDNSKCVRFESYYNDEDNTNFLKTPTLSLPAEPMQLTFWYKNPAGGDFSVYISTDGGSTYTTSLVTGLTGAFSWTKHAAINLSAYAEQEVVIVFKGTSSYGDGDAYIYLDDVTVEEVPFKAIIANSWYAISSPTHNSGNNETVAGVTNLTSGTYDLYRYDEANATWENQKAHNDFIFERGKGYIYRTNATKTLFFDGDVNSGNIDVELEATPAAGTMKGWNLLGNPYLTQYAPTVNYYRLSASGTWEPKVAGESSSKVNMGEGFLVKAASATTYTFTETPATKSAPASTIAFTVSNDEFTDIAYARFSSEEGLPKISHLNPEAPMLSIDGYAIANLNEGTESFPMSFSGRGSYTLTVSGNTDVTGYLHLVDRLTGRDIDLLSTPSYSFTGSPVSDRFTVKLTPDANEGNSTSRFAIFDGNSLIVNGEGTLEVYDVMGRRLMSAEVTGSEYRIPGSDLHTGVYVLRMNGNSQKIVIK